MCHGSEILVGAAAIHRSAAYVRHAGVLEWTSPPRSWSRKIVCRFVAGTGRILRPLEMSRLVGFAAL